MSEIRYQERGASWVPVLYGPGFALVGALVEWAIGGPVHVVAWTVVGLGLAAMTAPWVHARRKLHRVVLTPTTLWLGREGLDVDRIAVVDGVGIPAGTPVLGGSWTPPKNYEELPIRLDDGSVVLAWARDAEALRAAIREVKGWWP